MSEFYGEPNRLPDKIASIVIAGGLALGAVTMDQANENVHAEQQAPHIQRAPKIQPELADLTVNSRITINQATKAFRCHVQTSMRPDPQAERRATPREKACAQKIAAIIGKNSYGWDKRQQRALVQLWDNESKWSANADNPYSSAFGIPQAMTSEELHGPELRQKFGHGKYSYYKNPVSQIRWGLQYIHRRYGTPAKANAFWHGQCGGEYGCWY